MRKRSLLLTHRRSSTRFSRPLPFERSRDSSPDYEAMYAEHIEGFKAGSGEWASGCCPFHSDNSPSFAMNLENGQFMCRSSNCATAGTAIDFLMRHEGITYREARERLESFR